jgi:antitoxin component of MazEF toxin-antitoxin module
MKEVKNEKDNREILISTLYDLETLLNDVTEENLHEEIDTWAAVGNEI